MTATMAPLLLLLPLSVAAFSPSLRAQDTGADVETECRALCARADRGVLGVADVLAALGGEHEAVARTAAAIVRHEWDPLPAALFDGLDADPKAAYRLLEELARAPRPAAIEWAAQQARPRPGRSYDHRLLALAACAEPLKSAQARLLLESLVHESPGDGFHFAAALVPPRVADGLIGRIHQALMQDQVEVGALGSLLDRLSPRGVRSLLGLMVTLPMRQARVLLRHVESVRPQLVAERVAEALDGNVPLDPLWLRAAGSAIDRPERIERVIEVMRSGATEELRELAFEALLASKHLDEQVLDAMLEQADAARVRRILVRAGGQVPAGRLAAWLSSTPEVAHAAARALQSRRVLEPELQQALLALLADVEVADARTPLYAASALVRAGDQAALQRIWPLVYRSRAWSELFARLGRRTEPFVHEHLRTVLSNAPIAAEDPVEQEKLDTMRLLLVASGDRRELAGLVARAPDHRPTFLHRCRLYVRELSEAQANALFDAALAADDPEVSVALLEWAVAAGPASVSERLWRLWNEPPAVPAKEELREVAVRLLATGERREELLAQLRAAIAAGPLPDHMSSLPYEALNSMAEPLGRADVDLCATIVLEMPLADPEGEQRLARRWPDGTFGFPLVQAVANRLRTADELLLREVFTAAVDRLVEDPRARNISRQRLKVFWRAFAMRPDLQRAVGSITARLWTFADGDAAGGDGAAAFLLAVGAEERGAFADAARWYRRAARELLRLPFTRGEARWLLGDRDPTGGRDPFAALSAAPYRMQWRVDQKNPDLIRLIHEFAGHDRATLDSAIRDREETGR